MAPREQLTITYGGQALEAGLMDVRELAPALLAFGDLVQETNRVVNGGRAYASVQVQSEFKKGSFEIGLVLSQGLLEQAQEFLRIHPHIADAKEILDILFFYAGMPFGVYRFLVWLAGRKVPKDGVVFTNNGTVIINIENDTAEVSSPVYQIAENPIARQALEKFVAPLKQPGIDRLEVSRDNQREIITKDQLPFLQAGRRYWRGGAD